MQDQSAQTQSYVDAYTPPNLPPNTSSVSQQPITPPVVPQPIASPVTPPVAPLITPPVAPPATVPPAGPYSPDKPLQPGVVNKDDAQKALDELSKMFEDVPDKNKSVGLPSTEPVTPASSTLSSLPVAGQTPSASSALPPTPSVPTPSVEPQSSEQLLTEIQDALKAKDVKPSPSNNFSSEASWKKPLDQSSNFPPITPSVPAVPTAPPLTSPAPLTENKAAADLPIAPGLESEKLEDQNIFYLLGIDGSSSEQKEQFLDELQQVIWEDFIDHDVELLLTDKEFQELKTTYQLDSKKPLAEQEAVITYLEKLIPDLENLMLEKAIKLKADLVKERVAGLREKLAGQETKLAELTQADGLIAQEKWFSAAKILNQLGS